MSLIVQAQNLSFRYEGQLEPLFQNVTIAFYKGDKVALLGHNGAGKTTLLSLLLGDLTPTEGEVIRTGRVVAVQQEDRLEHTGTVLEALLAGTPDLYALYSEIQSHEKKGLPDPLRYADAINEFSERGGYDFLARLEAEVGALGFADGVLERSVAQLSGGERRLLKLMSVFLTNADLLILDEPTNYLDEGATQFLIDKVNAFSGACLLVSHDRWFLDQAVTKVLELEHRQIETYSGNYTTFRSTKDALFRQKVRQKEKLETEISKLQEIERTYKVWGARKEKEKSGAFDKGFIGARAAKLRKRAILAKERRQDRIEDLQEAKPWIDKEYALSFEQASVPSGTCLVVQDVHYSYGATSVLAGKSLTLEWGERLALRGNNGSGKSTFIKLLLGELEANKGEVLWSKGVKLGYLPQLWQSPNGATPAELFSEDEQQDARTMLGVLRVKGDSFFQPLESLSEGQKRKVGWVRLILSRPNVLILDEPTTHLDYESVEMLEAALQDYAGTLILVSHDKYLRERVAEREFVLP